MSDPDLVWFTDGACGDVRVAGGKGASLAAMTAAGLPVPPGFAIAAPVLERSVAAAEDSEAASFAGQQETYLNVEGADEVCARVVECWASFFSERALFYRSHKGSLEDLAMAVVVQRMVAAGKA